MQVESWALDVRKANRLGGIISLLVLVLCILLFILLELLFDYIFQIEFRSVKWMTVLYVMFFFAGTGGLIGIASLTGKRWSTAAIVLFLLMTLLAFLQRGITGM